jgi:hypothetical protein
MSPTSGYLPYHTGRCDVCDERAIVEMRARGRGGERTRPRELCLFDQKMVVVAKRDQDDTHTRLRLALHLHECASSVHHHHQTDPTEASRPYSGAKGRM